MLINYNYLKITDNLTAIKGSVIDWILENKIPYRLFNTSMIQIDDSNYLCLIRFAYNWYEDEPIIPGNSPRCNPRISDNNDKYFWWNNWHKFETHEQGGTLFVKYNINNNQFTEINTADNDDFFREFDTADTAPGLGYTSDMRICEINNIIYIYTSSLDNFIACIYDINTNKIEFLHITDFSLKGKNFAPFNTEDGQFLKSQLLYLDWFYGDHVLIRHLEHNDLLGIYQIAPSTHVKDIKINFTISGFYGEGSYKKIPYYFTPKEVTIAKAKYGSFYGITPGFSFTTPHIKIEENGKECWIGVGHSKIRNPASVYPYIEGSKIEEFRTKLHDQMFTKYGDKYKLHMGGGEAPACFGHIYLMYFYKLIHNGKDDYDMYLSDSYLPLDLSDETKDDYKFSLVFPMGIVKQKINGNDILKISCGEGDYNSIILDFDYKKVMESIKYDVKTFDITTYEYYLLSYKNGFSIQTTLRDDDKSISDVEKELNDKLPLVTKLTTDTQSEKLIKRKYIKYKTKYLQLKYGIKMLN